MNLTTSFWTTVSILVGIFIHTCVSQSCESLLEKTDSCVRKILYIGDDDLTAVRTDSQLQQHCSELEESLKCVKRYGKCLKLFPKQVFNILVRSTVKIMKDRCAKDKGRKEFLKHTGCIRKPAIIEYNRCIHKASDMLEFVNKNATDDQLIPALCCAFQDVKRCLLVKGDEYCLNVTGPETSKYIANIADTFTKDVIELVCGVRKTYEGCLQVEPQWMEIYHRLSTPFESIKSRKSGFFHPIITIAKRLDRPA